VTYLPGWPETANANDMDEILTAKELAAYLKLNDRTVLKLAADGVLPGVKVGGQWRFKKSVIDRWLDLGLGHADTGQGADTRGESLRVGELLDPELMLELDGSLGRDDVLSRLVASAAGTGAVRDTHAVAAALRARESVCSTAIGGGVAFPHARGLSGREVAGPVIVIGRAPGGVDFSAMDGEATYLVVMVCSPDTQQQMRLMGRLSCLLHRPETVVALMATDDRMAVVQQLRDAEQELFGGPGTGQGSG